MQLNNLATPRALVVVATLLIAGLLAMVAPGSASAAQPSDDELVKQLVAQPETTEIAHELNMTTEAVAETVVDELGPAAAQDIINHFANDDVDVKANFDSVKAAHSGGNAEVSPQKTCAKAVAAQIVFGAFGQAVCGAAAASSVGALEIPCQTLLMIGTSSLDWGQVC